MNAVLLPSASASIAAGERASDQLKFTQLKLSAATLNWLTNAIPLLLGLLAFAAMASTPSAILLSLVVVLPTAFRLMVAGHLMARRTSADLG